MLPDNDDPDKVLHDQKQTKSYATAQSNVFNINNLAGPSNELSTLEKDWEATEFGGWLSAHGEIQSLEATELRNLDSFALKRRNDARY